MAVVLDLPRTVISDNQVLAAQVLSSLEMVAMCRCRVSRRRTLHPRGCICTLGTTAHRDSPRIGTHNVGSGFTRRVIFDPGYGPRRMAPCPRQLCYSSSVPLVVMVLLWLSAQHSSRDFLPDREVGGCINTDSKGYHEVGTKGALAAHLQAIEVPPF